MKKMKKKIYKIEKSENYNKDNKLYNIILYTFTKCGCGVGKIFTGKYRECIEERKRLKNETLREVSSC